MQAELVGDLAQDERLHRDRAVREEALLALDDRLRDTLDSVEALLNRQGVKPVTVLELGCGTGAVITECQRRGLGVEFTAVDYSKRAIGYLESHSEGIHCMTADITDPAFTFNDSFDVVILCHVLEHLEDPLKFLQSMTAKISFRYLVAEVPLEDLLASRIKNLVRD